MKPPFEYRVQVKEFHLDTFGHVNNAMYLTLYEEARWDFITQNGFGLERIQSDQSGPVLLETTVKFKRELINREFITIVSTPGELNGKLMVINQQMIKENGKVASEASFTVGFMDMKERKLVSPPNDWLEACGYNQK
ncbi:MAG: acyl-CoA thioesterase [Bacteriovoracaceae bacterium]|nr:acyl-CoA thioesterase [Bacteriovoracaceae bacterium]